MKKQVIATILGAALALPLIAQAEGYYVGANVGRAEQKISIDGFGSDKDTDTGFKLYGGRDLTKNFGVEVGYVNFGKVGDSITDGADTLSVSLKPYALYLAGTGTLPLSEQFSVFAKVGVSMNRTKVSASANIPSEGFSFSDSTTERNTAAMVGIGAAYKFTPNMALVAEYENFGKVLDEDGVNVKADLVSVGLRYKF